MSASRREISPRCDSSALIKSGALFLALFLAGATIAHAEVTTYDKAPSVEELEQKLLGGDKGGQKRVKTRAIVFDNAAETAKPADSPTPHSADAQFASTPPAAAAGGGQRPQASENAIAFPIQFKVNSAQILPEAIPFLDAIAGLLQKRPELRLLVEGHTDISGNYQRNWQLSHERAASVVNFLVSRYGVDPNRLIPVGKGPTEPLPGFEPTDPRNRRVQFRPLG